MKSKVYHVFKDFVIENQKSRAVVSLLSKFFCPKCDNCQQLTGSKWLVLSNYQVELLFCRKCAKEDLPYKELANFTVEEKEVVDLIGWEKKNRNVRFEKQDQLQIFSNLLKNESNIKLINDNLEGKSVEECIFEAVRLPIRERLKGTKMTEELKGNNDAFESVLVENNEIGKMVNI